MTFDYRFKFVESAKERDVAHKFILSQDLLVPYPNYSDWCDKTIDETAIGYKGIIMTYNYGIPIADSVFQKYKEFQKIMEWKNLRVVPEERKGGIALFLESRITKLALEEKSDAIICDTRENPALEAMLKSRGYTMIQKLSLYDKNVEDRVYVKILKENTGIFQPLKNHIISSAA